jgi:hypothetical protein
MINDTIKVLDLPSIQSLNPINKNDVVRVLFEKRKEIEETFKDDEYLKMDLTHGEIIGLKSTAELDIPVNKDINKLKVGDRPAFNYLIERNDRYKNAEIIDLGNVGVLFKETGK